MSVFVVERNLPGISMDNLAAAQKAAINQAATMRAGGTPVNYVRSMFIPDDGRCFCTFTAETADVVAKLNTDAHIPFERVTTALDLEP